MLDVTATNEPTGGTAPRLHEDQKPPSRDTGGRHTCPPRHWGQPVSGNP